MGVGHSLDRLLPSSQVPSNFTQSVLQQGAVEEKGENARLSSFVGAMAIADLVRTTLGPKVCARSPSRALLLSRAPALPICSPTRNPHQSFVFYHHQGMDKILQSVSKGSQVTVTNDGATILKSIYVDNPAAKVLVDISKVQDDEVGAWSERGPRFLVTIHRSRSRSHPRSHALPWFARSGTAPRPSLCSLASCFERPRSW